MCDSSASSDMGDSSDSSSMCDSSASSDMGDSSDSSSMCDVCSMCDSSDSSSMCDSIESILSHMELLSHMNYCHT